VRQYLPEGFYDQSSMIGDNSLGNDAPDAGRQHRIRRALTMSFETSNFSSNLRPAKLTVRTGASYGCEEGAATKRLNRLLIDVGLIEGL
jgi:hypothetical protein